MEASTSHSRVWKMLIEVDRFAKGFVESKGNLLVVGKDLEPVYNGTWESGQELNLALVPLDFGNIACEDMMEEFGYDSLLKLLFKCLRRHPLFDDNTDYDETKCIIKVGTSDGPVINLNIWPWAMDDELTLVENAAQTLLFEENGVYYTKAIYFEDGGKYNLRQIGFKPSADFNRGFRIPCENYKYEGKDVEWIFGEYTGKRGVDGGQRIN